MVEAKFSIKCKGRSKNMDEILKEPVTALVIAHQRPGNYTNIGIDVECDYVGGGHGHKCLASKEKDGICPYSIDLPYTIRT